MMAEKGQIRALNRKSGIPLKRELDYKGCPTIGD
jgi:hypothetical protein